jgi:hypothetical protein
VNLCEKEKVLLDVFLDKKGINVSEEQGTSQDKKIRKDR